MDEVERLRRAVGEHYAARRAAEEKAMELVVSLTKERALNLELARVIELRDRELSRLHEQLQRAARDSRRARAMSLTPTECRELFALVMESQRAERELGALISRGDYSTAHEVLESAERTDATRADRTLRDWITGHTDWTDGSR